MQSDATRLREFAQVRDGVDETVGIVTRAARDRDRVSVDEPRHCIDVDDEAVGERCIAHLDAEPVRPLAKGDVDADGQHDVGHAYAARLARLLAIGVERVDQAVAATRGHDADGLRVVEEVGRHGDDLALELGCRGVHVTLQDIGVSEVLEDLREEVVVPVVAAVEAARDSPRITHCILGLSHAGDVGEHRVALEALLRDRALRRHRSPVGEEVVEHALQTVVRLLAHQSMPFDRRPTARSVSRLASRSAMA